ncbi:MAG: hypothetical protein U0V70_09615 [Terriglobia bacterium]
MRLPPLSTVPLFLFVVAAATTWIVIGCRGKSSNSPSPATLAEAESYKSKIELTHLGLAKGESFLGDHVYYVEGKVTNSGDRRVQRIELIFVFKDNLNQIVLRESRKAVEYKGGGGLGPKQTTNFQVAFDHLPKDWNHILPEIEVGNLVLN